MSAKQKSLTATFTKERITKGAIKYTEDGKPEEHKSGSLYLRKSALNGETPDKLTVAIKF